MYSLSSVGAKPRHLQADSELILKQTFDIKSNPNFEASLRNSYNDNEPTINPASNGSTNSSQVKVTHQVSHILIEVNEFDPRGSTISSPTNGLMSGKPITSATMSPVFIPKISVDGRPLPLESKRYPADVADGSVIPTEPPLTYGESAPLKVVSHYSSTSVDSPLADFGAKSSSNNISLTNETGNSSTISIKHSLSNELQSSDVKNISVKTVESMRKEQLKAYLSDELPISQAEKSKMNSVLEIEGDEVAIESLVSPIVTSEERTFFSNLQGTEFITSEPTTNNKQSISSIQESINSSTVHIVDVESMSITTPLSLLSIGDLDDNDKAFKREAVDESVSLLKKAEVSSLYEDYEKEDADLFAGEGLSRDPRIYFNLDDNHEDIEKKKLKTTKAKPESEVVSFQSQENFALNLPGEQKEIEGTKDVEISSKSNNEDFNEPSSTLKTITVSPPNTEPESNLPKNEPTDERDEYVVNSNIPPYVDEEDSYYSDLDPLKSRIASVIRQKSPMNFSDTPSVSFASFDENISTSNTSSKSQDVNYDDSVPTAAAVAEAAVLTDLSHDKPKNAR